MLMAENESDDEAFEKLLNEFISTHLDDVEPPDSFSNTDERPNQEASDVVAQEKVSSKEHEADLPELEGLRPEEKALARAYLNFCDGIVLICDEFKLPDFDVHLVPEMLIPNYKPSLGQKIVDDALAGWDVLIKAFPNITSKISPDMSDEKLLDFAEKSSHEALQFALISYVEILIEMEGCEISYKERKLRKEKRRLEREIYLEHQRRAEKAKAYIDAIQAKNFPINAEKLVKNFFKTADKDPKGAFEIFTENPAVFSPIDFSKIKPRFFGLLKVGPQDGIRMNRIIGNFLKHLKL